MKKQIHPGVAVAVIVAMLAVVWAIYMQKTRVVRTDETPPGMPPEAAAEFARRMSTLGQMEAEVAVPDGEEAGPTEGEEAAAPEALSDQAAGPITEPADESPEVEPDGPQAGAPAPPGN